MQPQYISLATIFGPQARYTVPLFQRPYVWNKAEQWEPLWDDVQALAERVLLSTDGSVAGHFLGTAVLEQASVPIGSLPRREIIDGQQRLTTLQLLLKAGQHVLETLRDAQAGPEQRQPYDVAARQIGMLNANPAFATEEEKYKVWPTNQDRASFAAVMDAESAAVAPTSGTRMAEAYGYFRDQISRWLDGGEPQARVLALTAALKDHLRLIVLDLDTTDEPQAIFETLNAHGTPLLPADLIKNWLIWEANLQKIPSAGLYDRYWKAFDENSDYWRAKAGAGHAARAKIDTFLQNWLTRRTREAVPGKHLYDRFLRHVGARPQTPGAARADIEALMKDIAADAERYVRIDGATGADRFSTFLRRLKTFDFVVFQPVLMALMGRSGSDQGDLDTIGRMLEAWLLRRMICNEDTRGYGTAAVVMLEALAQIPAGSPAAPTFKELLTAPGGLGFPSDDAFSAAWRARPFYGYYRRERVVMILRAIEEAHQTASALAEPIIQFNFDKLTVEHVLPQSWELHWPLEPELDRSVRDSLVHTIGNLTLVTGKLNPSLSNAAWLDKSDGKKVVRGKRSGLDDHSVLRMNAKLVSDHPERWDEASIRKRTDDLLMTALTIWPTP